MPLPSIQAGIWKFVLVVKAKTELHSITCRFSDYNISVPKLNIFNREKFKPVSGDKILDFGELPSSETYDLQFREAVANAHEGKKRSLSASFDVILTMSPYNLLY